MPYCSLEEAWGSDFKDVNYYSKVNESPASSSVQNKKALDTPEEKKQTSELDKYFPSYSGGAPAVSHVQTAKSNIVPYQVSFPDRSKRNYLYPVENEPNDDDSDEDSALELLEDNDRDMRYIDRQRRVVSNFENDYMTTDDYFLYKKYLKLAEKYKDRLRKKYRNFMAEDSSNKNILEGFSNKSTPQNVSLSGYSIKEMIIIIIVGIFLIFALDIFVKMGAKMK